MILLTVLTIIQIIFLTTLIIQIADLMRYNEKLVIILDKLFDIIVENNNREDDGK